MKGYTVSCVGRSGEGLETLIWLASDLLELGACELDTLGNMSLMKYLRKVWLFVFLTLNDEI